MPITNPFLSATLPPLQTLWKTTLIENQKQHMLCCYYNTNTESYVINYTPSATISGYWFETAQADATLADLIQQLLNQDCDIVVQQHPDTTKQLPLLFARHLLTISEIKLDMNFVVYIVNKQILEFVC